MTPVQVRVQFLQSLCWATGWCVLTLVVGLIAEQF
jgi:hypothetical protein